MNEHLTRPVGPHPQTHNPGTLVVDGTQLLPAGAVPLPDGGWVVMRDYRTMDGADCKAVLSTIGSGPVGENSVKMREAILGQLIVNWSFEHLPVPPTGAVLGRLPATVYMALLTMVKEPYDMINGTSVRPKPSKEAADNPSSPSAGSSE